MMNQAMVQQNGFGAPNMPCSPAQGPVGFPLGGAVVGRTQLVVTERYSACKTAWFCLGKRRVENEHVEFNSPQVLHVFRARLSAS